MSAEFALGDRVTFTRELARRSTDDWSGRTWEPQGEYGEPKEGVVVGKRMLNNGTFQKKGDPNGEGAVAYPYRTTESFTAYLISYDLRRKPVYALPEHISHAGEFCPFDCDSCHDPDCPCDRMGCAGSDVELAS